MARNTGGLRENDIHTRKGLTSLLQLGNLAHVMVLDISYTVC
jgi:hypothetical protein